MADKSKRTAVSAATLITAPKVEQRGRILSKLIISGFLILCTIFVAGCIGQPKVICRERHQYVVLPGDTLWEIAAEMKAAGDHREIRQLIYDIRRQNNLGDVLHPGQKIELWLEVVKSEKD